MTFPTLDDEAVQIDTNVDNCTADINTDLTWASGDLGIIVSSIHQPSTPTTLTINQSWTALHNTLSENANRELSARSFGKILGATETNPTITHTNANNGGMVCWMMIISGDSGDVADIAAGTTSQSNPADGDPELPAVTFSPDEDRLIVRAALLGNDRFNSGHTLPGGHTQYHAGENAGANASYGYCTTTDATSPAAAVDWTALWNESGDEGEAGISLAIKPSGAGPSLSIPVAMHAYRQRHQSVV